MSSSEAGAEGEAAPNPESSAVSAPADFTARAKLPFRVVGIGASAGGVEALRNFFVATAPDSGMAYVVIQHLSPEHHSLMAEILGRCTSMPVRQIEDGMRVEPDHVYVIRPGFTVTLEDGVLRLGEPVEKQGHRRPIDDFFRSLAREQQESAIAVVLSGTGTNGSAGAQAIKAAGGLCIAQDPDTADFPGMPQSLIYSGYADQILKTDEIPPALVRYARHPDLIADSRGILRAGQAMERHRQELNEILTVVRVRTGHDFTAYKPPTVLRRIQRRMGLLGMTELAEYANVLREKSAEAAALANDLMINVTGFFRDPEVWQALREAVVRPLVDERASGESLRAWVTACASGEEAYSLAMLIAEEAQIRGKTFEVKIFATDTADRSLALARAGVYPGGIEGDLSPERLDRFFEKDEHTYRIRRELRDQVVFAPQDLLRDPPFSRVDLVTCRNLLIYLEPEAQQRALTLLHFALREGGYLLLGNAETLGRADGLFEVVSKRWRIYRRSSASQPHLGSLPPFAARPLAMHVGARPPATPIGRTSAPVLIQAALLEKLGPPTVVIDANERIVYFHGDTGPFLQNPPGEATQSLLEMVRIPLRAAVRSALRQAVAERRSVTVSTDGHEIAAPATTVTADRLNLGGSGEYFCISFSNGEGRGAVNSTSPVAVANPTPSEARSDTLRAVPMLEEELRQLRRELQSSVEAFEASNEELKASNEEVTSVNEELQSTNEELETGKEELQSLNEELATVNAQLQSKILELEALTNDLDNLLSSTDIAVVFLDSQLNVRRFTPAISDLLELIPADVGRPLAHLAQKFTDGNLIADASQVIAKLVPLEAEAHSHSDRWYLRRTLPYRTEDDRIAGVVITFVDITARKRAEQAIGATQARLQAVVEQMPAAVVMAEAPSGKLLLANRQAAALFNQPFPMPLIGHNWATAYTGLHGVHGEGGPYHPHQWPLARALAKGEVILDEEVMLVRQDGGRTVVSMSASPVRNSAGELVAAVAAFWDVTARRRAQEALRESEEHFRMLVESAHDYAIFMLDLTGRVVSWNRGAERVTGFTDKDILGRPAAILFTPEDRATGIPELEMRGAAETGQAVSERWHLRRDGTRFWASGAMTVAQDSAGARKGFVKIMRDQTERKSLDARLQEALQSAQQSRLSAEGANRAKDEFISTVSHELRTPLNTIRLWSTMFMSGKLQGAEVKEGGEKIDRAALAQQQLIDDLLDVSRMASGSLRLALRDTPLVDAVSGAVEAVRPLAQSKHIQLETTLSEQIGIVQVDPDRIQQVVWNLLANAVKFTPEGGRVSVRMWRVDATVQIEVSDTGVGIDPEFLPQVFDRFRQADAGASRRYSGLGLGLAIAKQLVDLHGGTIIARSEGKGQGASFTVHLPLQSRPPPATGAHTAESAKQRPQNLSAIDILLVEDEAPAREATERLLRQFGAQVRAVDSAAHARGEYERQHPDVIIADIGMPGEDGYTFLEGIRHLEVELRNGRVPAIALTAFARRQDRQRAMAAGFDEHLAKPVDAAKLVEALTKLVDRTSENQDG
jgi:two-component system, chemotaxis family, CheB/CheR fusion protein